MGKSATGLGSSSARLTKMKGGLAYALMLGLGIGGYLLIRSIGEGRAASSKHSSGSGVTALTTQAHPAVDVVFHVLLTLAVVVALGYILGRLFRFIGQPPVIGEIVAGLCLGPSLLGVISPTAMHLLIPAEAADPQGHVTAALKMIAELGIVLYMFVVGLELNTNKLKDQVHSAVAISHVSIIVPFLLGAILAIWLHPHYAPQAVTFTTFSLFLGVTMAITAFPVLARILTDREMEGTRLGSIALACAAADDATAWCLLALVVGIAQTKVADAIVVGGACLAYIAGMFLIIRPLIHLWCRQMDDGQKPLPHFVLVLGLVGVLMSAVATEMIGIHAIFGAFMLGAMIPSECRLAQELKTRLRESVTILLLPAFFAYTGMRTEIGLVSGWDNWLVCTLIIVVATVGKFGGTLMAARATGIGWRDAAALGTLMNTRGMMELIVLNLGLDLGVISPQLFAMMVLMALLTTVATSPILSWLVKEDEADAGKTPPPGSSESVVSLRESPDEASTF